MQNKQQGQEIGRIPVDFGGGCSVRKAELLADLVLTRDSRLVVELGVYRGRSLLPMGLAAAELDGCRVVGIDPWSGAEARQFDDHGHGSALLDWASSQDWPAIRADVERQRSSAGLDDVVELVAQTSTEAANHFAESSIDLLHVDGNHDGDRVREDIVRWMPLVRPGGVIVLDDITWASVRPVYDDLVLRCNHLFEVCTREDDFAVFEKRPS